MYVIIEIGTRLAHLKIFVNITKVIERKREFISSIIYSTLYKYFYISYMFTNNFYLYI